VDKQKEIIENCIKLILQHKKRPLLVAITGESGSGKSHLTKAICNQLEEREINYSFVNHDDFLIPRAEREKLREKVYQEGEYKGKTYWEILENWYYLDQFQVLIDLLKAGKTAKFYPYEHETGETSNEAKIIKPADIIILENKLFLEQMDFVIELVVDRKKIIDRKIKRDSDVRTPKQTIEMHEKVQGFFWDRCKPNNPDIVIDNNDYENPVIVE
jgi:uridine kinase